MSTGIVKNEIKNIEKNENNKTNTACAPSAFWKKKKLKQLKNQKKYIRNKMKLKIEKQIKTIKQIPAHLLRSGKKN